MEETIHAKKRRFPFMRNKREKRMFKMLWDQLFEELKSCRGANNEGVPRELIEKLRLEAPAESDVDATDIYRIEIASFPYLSKHELKIRLLGLRDMMYNLSTKETYQQTSQEFNKDLENSELNLDEAYALSNRLYRRYVLVPSIENVRTSIARSLLAIALAASTFSIIQVVIAPDHWLSFLDLGYALGLSAGICGSVVSTLTRLYRFDPRHEPLLTWLSLEQGKSSIIIIPFLGGIFAFVLILLIRGDLLQGPLFPALSAKNSETAATGDCWLNLQPTFIDDCKNYADLSKLIIWCFISGWSERFIPDVLDKLSTQGIERANSFGRQPIA